MGDIRCTNSAERSNRVFNNSTNSVRVQVPFGKGRSHSGVALELHSGFTTGRECSLLSVGEGRRRMRITNYERSPQYNFNLLIKTSLNGVNKRRTMRRMRRRRTQYLQITLVIALVYHRNRVLVGFNFFCNKSCPGAPFGILNWRIHVFGHQPRIDEWSSTVDGLLNTLSLWVDNYKYQEDEVSACNSEINDVIHLLLD